VWLQLARGLFELTAAPQVEVCFSFGETMIEVTAVDQTTGKQQSNTVEFAKSYRK
jgi:hypothetical protein